ncbi:uncharacterized protein NMK_3119 [Novimethylophilus kurashikiensis]|uniref:Uncharacterized protein n=2 Tax=Novimethylophilus kurashikiensis TaxID=1825523 RepID=A0A2R5FHA5_9PROT|nr:uncharacterized protein NMK_3119 [Novimethylophilus kurashikiensis]
MNFRMRRLFFSLLLLPCCAWADGPTMTRVLQSPASIEKFLFCDGGTCAEVQTVHLTKDEWQEVRDLFDPQPETAEQEREVLRDAIGLMERIVGPKTGTDDDRGGTFGNSEYPGQLDCNDEATNSTTYMRLMAADGLLRFHRIADTKTRGGFLFFGRHSAAVISEIATGKFYAVDSWFYDNGYPAEILPLEQWRSGWRPALSSAH